MTLKNGIVALGLLALGLAPAPAQNYPNRPISFVVPFAPGGLTDVPARVLAPIMQEKLGASIVVENKTGASGVVGATHVLRADPDGYTLLVNALADVQNLHYIKVPYDAVADFTLIGKITDGPPLVLVVNAALPYKSLKELIDDAKGNPNKISFGTSGPATSPAIAITQLNATAGTKIVDVPYRGSGEAAAAVVTGAVQATFTFYLAAKPLVEAGKIRPLAVAGAQRIPAWPDVPTMEELGYKNFNHSGFVGLVGPAKLPQPIVATLLKALNESIHTELFKTRMQELGMTIPDAASNTPERFAAYMRAERERQAELAKLSGHNPMSAK
ncbi:Bug family tripartite tricarboxylate transporter substrate binding protein [Rhodoplanes sp. Z2-YC6860]|uniref:Bug family tripartite tricarboxylate transporter substrate binding protein n=1 Tax=Rhodoplanes sp. Z2-YC6860 TaxID=674703 RepID=UPI000A4D8240|nr:tripartite tricarboxylate transporter substrate binding protein [Rhodoplanes sp. Z2-YC6860]